MSEELKLSEILKDYFKYVWENKLEYTFIYTTKLLFYFGLFCSLYSLSVILSQILPDDLWFVEPVISFCRIDGLCLEWTYYSYEIWFIGYLVLIFVPLFILWLSGISFVLYRIWYGIENNQSNLNKKSK